MPRGGRGRVQGAIIYGASSRIRSTTTAAAHICHQEEKSRPWGPPRWRLEGPGGLAAADADLTRAGSAAPPRRWQTRQGDRATVEDQRQDGGIPPPEHHGQARSEEHT